MLDWILYFTVKSCGIVVRLIPVSVALFLARGIGFVVYCCDAKHRRQVRNNLRTALGGERSYFEIKRLTRTFFQNYCQNVVELLRLPLLTKDRYGKFINIEGKEHVLKALEGGKGLILLAMHSGSWELANLASAMFDRPYKVIVKPQKKFPRLNQLLNSYRECSGSVVIERGIGVRGLLEGLKANEIIALVVDQGGKNGLPVEFFGRKANLADGAVRIALKTGAPVCFASIYRHQGSIHKLIIQPPLKLVDTGNLANDVVQNLKQVASVMERLVRQHPAEYMWFYKVWKYSNQRTTLILDDGRTGHLRQSQAVASQLSVTLEQQSLENFVVEAKVVYKNSLARFWASVVPNLPLILPLIGRIRLLRWVLKKESYEDVLKTKADFLISTGSAGACVSDLLKRENQAKNVAVLKPGLLNFKKLDLVLLPAHDRERYFDSPENVIFTKGAPNLITAEYLEQQAQALRSRFSHLKQGDNFKIGILLGGDTKQYVMKPQKIRIILNQIKEFADEINADIYMTTSRRTPPGVEQLVVRELKKFARCKLLIIANRNNVAEAVGGILSISDVLVVSGDSVSMISEAASSGRKTVVFPLEARLGVSGGRHKHQKFIDNLNEQGIILSAPLRNIKTSLYNVVKNKITLRPLDDNVLIRTGLKRII